MLLPEGEEALHSEEGGVRMAFCWSRVGDGRGDGRGYELHVRIDRSEYRRIA